MVEIAEGAGRKPAGFPVLIVVLEYGQQVDQGGFAQVCYLARLIPAIVKVSDTEACHGIPGHGIPGHGIPGIWGAGLGGSAFRHDPRLRLSQVRYKLIKGDVQARHRSLLGAGG